MNIYNDITITILGNNPDITDELVSDLEVLGFTPVTGNHRDTDTGGVTQHNPDIVVVDLTECDFRTLPVFEGIVQEETLPPETVLVALVSRNSMRQVPLDYNFDEIITWPYELPELSYRLRRLVHLRNREPIEDTIRIGNLSISPSRYEVKVNDRPIALSHKEYELFKFLFTHPSHVFTREELFVTIWGNEQLGESRTVDVHIRRIRAKIGDTDQTYIKTVRGVGYTLRFENN